MDQTSTPPVRVGETHTARLGVGAHKGKAYRLIRLVLALGAAAFVYWHLSTDWPAIAATRVESRWLWLSAAAMSAALLGQVVAWRWNLRQLGEQVGFLDLFRLYYASNMARYLPGKWWSIVGMVAGGSRLGLSPEPLSVSVFVGLVSSLVSGLFVGSVAAIAIGQEGILSTGFMVVPALSLLLIIPPIFRRWSGWILRKFGRDVCVPMITGRLLWRSVLHYGLVWCFYASAVGLIAWSVGVDSFGLYFAVFPLAYLAGYVALFAPGGWGVREGAIVVLAGGGTAALAVALIQRFMLTGFELVLFGYSIWSWRK